MMYEQITFAKSQSSRASAEEADKIAALRSHLSPREQELFGIGEPYARDSADAAPFKVLLRGLAASMATTTLFLTVAVLAMPPAAFA